MQRFPDRAGAGQVLGRILAPRYGQRDDTIVLALPRGGVPVGFQIATALDAPLDVFLVRKLGVPGHEELAMGAIASGGVRVLNPEVLDVIPISSGAIERVAAEQERELVRREQHYRGDRGGPDVRGKTVLLVDDGLATGSTMRAAVVALRQLGPEAIVVAVPVAARETCEAFTDLADEVVCAATPEPFHAVGLWYDDFSQTSDEEVRELLDRAARAVRNGAGRSED